MNDSQITSVLVTELKRTQETAAAIAKAGHVTPTVIPANDIGVLAEKLCALDANALVVGHGNTIADLPRSPGIATPLAFPKTITPEIFAAVLDDAPQLVRLPYP